MVSAQTGTEVRMSRQGMTTRSFFFVSCFWVKALPVMRSSSARLIVGCSAGVSETSHAQAANQTTPTAPML